MTVNMKLIVNPDIRLESITKETTEALYPLFMEDIRELNRWFGFDADYSIQNDYHYLDNRKPPYDDAIVVFYRGVPCGRFGLYDYSPGENLSICTTGYPPGSAGKGLPSRLWAQC